jgi:hypothetical protein
MDYYFTGARRNRPGKFMRLLYNNMTTAADEPMEGYSREESSLLSGLCMGPVLVMARVLLFA